MAFDSLTSKTPIFCTPPFPLATATVYFTFGKDETPDASESLDVELGFVFGLVTAIVTDTSEIKLWDLSKDSTSFLIFVGVVASEEVIAILTLALP